MAMLNQRLTMYKFRGGPKVVEIVGEPFVALAHSSSNPWADPKPKWHIEIRYLSRVQPCFKGRFKHNLWPSVRIRSVLVSPFSDNFPEEIRKRYSYLPSRPPRNAQLREAF